MSSKPRLVDLRGGRKIPPPAPEDLRPQLPRRSALKLKKRRTRAVVSAAICVCALLTTYAVHAASYLPRFTYQKISITGAQTVSATDIQNFALNKLGESSRGFISGRNIFVYNYGPLGAQIVANFAAIKDARVSRDTTLGNGLVVTITERSPYARWCEEGNDAACYLLDDQGVVFASAASTASTTLPTPYVFTGLLSTSTVSVSTAPYGEMYGAGHFSGINSLLKQLRDLGVTPLGASLQDDTDFFVPLAEGFYIKASYGEDPEMLTKNLTLILSADALKDKESLLEYVDLRFGNRVYYKFKNEAEAAQTPAVDETKSTDKKSTN